MVYFNRDRQSIEMPLVSPSKANAPQPLSLGASLVERSCNLAAIAYQVSNFAANKGTRSVCAATALATGATNIYAGNYVSGLTIGGCGVKELYTLLTDSNRGNRDRLKQLLNSAEAGVGMVQTLEEANSKSFGIINANIDEVQKGVQNLNSLMTAIGKIASDCSANIGAQKLVALQGSKEANDLFTQAYEALSTSREKTEKANNELQNNLLSHEKLVKVATEGGKNCTESFLLIAESMKRRSIKIQELLQESTTSMDKGMQLLDQARTKQHEAEMAVNRAVDIAEAELRLISEKGKVQKEHEAQIDQIRRELFDIEERREDQRQLLDQVSGDLNEARDLANANFGNMSLILGGGLGFMSGNVVGGIPGAFVGIKIGAELVHNRKSVLSVLLKIYHLIFGKTSEDFMPPVRISPLISYQFFSKSSGIWNRVKGRQSWTCGEAHIKVGNEVVSYEFNLNEKRNKISERDLKKLSEKLTHALQNNQITPLECKEIISRLESVTIGRGPDYTEPAVGFIQQSCPYFGELKRRCDKALLKGL